MRINLLTNLYIKISKFRENRRIKKLKNNLGLNETIQIQSDLKVGNPKNLYVGDYVYIGPDAIIQTVGIVELGRGVIIGPGLRVYSANHRFREASSIPYDNVYNIKKVTIEDNVWIGGGVTLLPGVIIGEGSIIGAGAVVSGVIEKYSIAVGNPAKAIGKRDIEHYTKLKNEDKIYLKLKQINML